MMSKRKELAALLLVGAFWALLGGGIAWVRLSHALNEPTVINYWP